VPHFTALLLFSDLVVSCVVFYLISLNTSNTDNLNYFS
jgi:hypothetical protein